MNQKVRKQSKNEGIDKEGVEKTNIAWKEWQNYKKLVAKFDEKPNKVSQNTRK